MYGILCTPMEGLFYLMVVVTILSNFPDEELVNDVEMKEEEEAKPVQTTSTKKKKEESIEDKREHINIIFIGHVGKKRIQFSIKQKVFPRFLNIFLESQHSIFTCFQMLGNQQLEVTSCE